MQIGIDGNEANLEQRVGVGQYAYNIIKELASLDKKNIYHIYLKNTPLPDMPPASKNWHYHVFGPAKLWTKLALPFHLYTDGLKLDLFYSPSHYSPHFSPFPTVPTIHDLGYLSTNDQFTKKDLYQLTAWTKHSLQHAHHIIAVSEFTKREINRIYGINLSKISVAYNGVSAPHLKNTDFKTVLKKFNLHQPYFLYLGTLKPSKNIPFLIEAFSHVHNHQLVIAGKKGWLFDSIFNTVKKFHLENSVVFTDYISETEKWLLYQNAIATVLPSLYEGFGIPAIESQISSTPVIASNIPAFREVLDNSAIFINPTDINSLVAALSEVQKPAIRKNLIQKGLVQSQKFSWQNSAHSLIDAFSNI
jgi:glycosyltransferase involved in cell wall biosynthesis